jgi:hypothetical protein
MDKEMKKSLGTTWSGNLIKIDELPELTTEKGTFKKAEVVFLPDGCDIASDCFTIGAFGYSANDILKCKPGDRAEIAFIPKQYLSKAGYINTSLDLLSVKAISFSDQEQPAPVLKPDEIYPVGTKLPTPPDIKTGAIKESDFDFSEKTDDGETIPF